MIKYWKWTFYTLNKYLITYDDANPSSEYKEITKKEYYDEYGYKQIAQNNIIHNYFNGAEQALKLAKTLYIEELGNLIVQGDADAPQHYKDFLVYMEAVINVSLDRANTLYDSELAGNTEEVAIGKATAVVIKDDNYSAIAGRDAFLKWAVVKFPQLRTYLNNVNSLKYTTTLTEDEPQ